MQDECPLGVAHHDLGLGRVGEKGDAAGRGQVAPEGGGSEVLRGDPAKRAAFLFHPGVEGDPDGRDAPRLGRQSQPVDPVLGGRERDHPAIEAALRGHAARQGLG